MRIKRRKRLLKVKEEGLVIPGEDPQIRRSQRRDTIKSNGLVANESSVKDNGCKDADSRNSAKLDKLSNNDNGNTPIKQECVSKEVDSGAQETNSDHSTSLMDLCTVSTVNPNESFNDTESGFFTNETDTSYNENESDCNTTKDNTDTGNSEKEDNSDTKVDANKTSNTDDPKKLAESSENAVRICRLCLIFIEESHTPIDKIFAMIQIVLPEIVRSFSVQCMF